MDSVIPSYSLNHFAIFKCQGIYITHLTSRSLVGALCKFRIILHSFKVNLLRRSKGKYFVDTICSNCNSGAIKDEFYVLFICDKYKHIRNAYLRPQHQNKILLYVIS